MSEKMAIAEMILIALMLGAGVNLRRRASILDKCILFAVDSFGMYCIMCVGRMIFLRTGMFYSYTQDIRLLIIDILMGMTGAVLLPKITPYIARPEKGSTVRVAPVCIVITFAGALLYQYVNYRNFNSALYHCLLPEAISVVGLMVWMEISLISRAIRKGMDVDRRRRWDQLSVTVTSAFVITAFEYPFLEIFLSNSTEFSFTIRDMIPYFILFLAIVFLITMTVLNHLSGRIWEWTVLGICSFTLAAYVQALFLNRQLFLMDGVNREWAVGFKVLNLLVWAGLTTGVFILRHFCKGSWKGVVKFGSIAIALMQIAGGFSLIISNGGHFEARKETDYFATEGLYEVAAEDNVIVFVLDKYDEKYMQEVLAKEPDFLEPLKGFVGFPDTVAQFSRTYPAITYMLTNRTFFDVPAGQRYIDWAFEDCTFWRALTEKDFQLYFYEEETSYIGESVQKQACNYVQQGEILKREISLTGCIRSIHTVNCYRIMPYFVKDYYRYTEDTINDLVISDKVWKQEQYEMDDADIKERLDQSGLTINDDRKAFRFIHMFGAHPPYSMDREGNRVGESKDLSIDQYMGSMQIVYNYLEELRRLGLYENATIIITADHGDNFENGAVLPEKVNIILYVKPKGSAEEPLRYSEAYASQCDLLPTLAGEVGIAAEDGQGIDLLSSEAYNQERERFHYFHVVENMKQIAVRTYRIKGSSLDFNNWIATDEYNDFR